jgi:hypothetical protein
MSGAPYARITKGADLDRLICATSAMELPGRVELLRAVRRGEITLLEVNRQGMPPSRVLKASARPLLAVVGDDDYASTGPCGWAAARRLQYWARAGMIHATGADVPSYQAVIGMTLLCRRFLLVETDSAHLDEWGAALRKYGVPFLGLRPPTGAHPVAPDRSALQ